MSSGTAHGVGYAVGLTILAGTSMYIVAQGAPVENALGLFAGGLLGIIADPDVRDMHNKQTKGESRVYAIPHVGPILGPPWKAYWSILARFIPHRSPFSHLPVFATSIAAAWLFLPALCLVWFLLVGTLGGFFIWLADSWQPWMTMLLAGWSFQDFIHLIQDKGGIRWRIRRN